MDSELKYKLLIITAFIFGLMSHPAAQAQQADTTLTDNSATVVEEHSPRRAVLYSAVLPGLGQAYNKKYWKVPVIYAGFGVLTYWAINANDNYRKYYNDYRMAVDTSLEYNGLASVEELEYYKDEYRRSRDLSFIVMAGLYIINIIDASVDAHFYDFDVSNNLSMRIEPMYYHIPLMKNTHSALPGTFGLRCYLNLKSY